MKKWIKNGHKYTNKKQKCKKKVNGKKYIYIYISKMNCLQILQIKYMKLNKKQKKHLNNYKK